MENLPREIISEILLRLPIEIRLQCKHVCKTWRKLLDHVKVGTLFAIGSEDHNKHSRVRFFYMEKPYGEIDSDGEVDIYKRYPWYEVSKYKRNDPDWFNSDIVVGSCNGLVCLAIIMYDIHDPVFIFNPFIPNDFINLPPLRKSLLEYGRLVVSGFGYARSTDEYKVIRIYYSDNDDDSLYVVGQVEVYTIGSGDGWRYKGEIRYLLCDSPGVHVDGVLHWLDYNNQWRIVAFDLVTEEFRVLPSPPCFQVSDGITTFSASTSYEFLDDNFQLHVLGGFLCVIHTNKGKRLDIWAVKKKEHKHEWIWSKEFGMECLEKDHTYEPFAITRNNKLLLWYDKSIPLCYDPKIAALGKLSDYELVSTDVKYYQAIPHMKTSVSVVALEGKVQKISRAYQSKRKKKSTAMDAFYTDLGRVTWLDPDGKSLK